MDALSHLFLLGAADSCKTTAAFGISLYHGLTCDANQNIVLTSLNDVLVIVTNVVAILIALAGGLAVVMIMIASIYYIVSTGDSSRTKTAKDIIMNTIVGLLILISAEAVVLLISNNLK